MERSAEFPLRPFRPDASTAPGPEARDATAALAARIREAAAALGFEAVGIARAAEHPHGVHLRAWLEAGRHGTMKWMERDPERRADPGRAMPGARSLIAVACSYYRGGWAESTGAPRGRVARYAWGRDYHRTLLKRLLTLGRVLEGAAPGAGWRAYVDTGPVLDRAWAERAGIGWIGKNTNLIRKGAGSWWFLGEILTDVALPGDPPARGYCGTCERCIAACPTGAILGPYRLDARRCISYLTIEHSGSIPAPLRSAIGSRIFGCDDCQEVCPWNRFAVASAHPELRERPGQAMPALIPLLALDDASFRARYAGTAVRRAGRDRFVRNVAVALGNAADPSAIPALSAALRSDRDPFVRGHAAWALGRIGGPEARGALAAAAGSEASPEALLEIREALAAAPLQPS